MPASGKRSGGYEQIGDINWPPESAPCDHDWEYLPREPGETYTGYCERCSRCGEIVQIAQ